MARRRKRPSQVAEHFNVTPRDLWRSVGRMVGIVLGMTLMYAFMPLYGPRWWLGTFAGIGAIAALLPLTVRRTAAIVNSDRPMFEMAEGMLLLITMLVIGFSVLYIEIQRTPSEFEGLRTRLDATYFTLTTLSTVGYGDIHANGQVARAAVTAQIILDFSVVGLAVKTLSNAAQRRTQRALEDA